VKILRRLEKKGIVKRYPNRNPYARILWTLQENDFVALQSIPHEVDMANLFDALYLAAGEDLTHWDWHREEDEDYDHKRYPLWDARLVYRGLVLAIEQDNGTESPEALMTKIDRYIRHSEDKPTKQFDHILFSMKYTKDGWNLTPDQRQNRAQRRTNKLLEYLEKKQRGNQFLVTYTESLLQDPLGKVVVSPEDRAYAFSLSSLRAKVTA
jgi:hypothetical protein